MAMMNNLTNNFVAYDGGGSSSDRIQVNDPAELNNDAKTLYVNLCQGKADSMLAELEKGINGIKGKWTGPDAAKHIRKLIGIYNDLLVFRDKLANIAGTISQTAVGIENTVVANGGTSYGISPLVIDTDPQKGVIYMSDTGIDDVHLNVEPDLEQPLQGIVSVATDFNDLRSSVNSIFGKIMDNWVSGLGRNYAKETCDEFSSKVDGYVETISGAANAAKDAYAKWFTPVQ